MFEPKIRLDHDELSNEEKDLVIAIDEAATASEQAVKEPEYAAQVVVNCKSLNVNPSQLNIPIGEFVDAMLYQQEEERITEYLRKKYDGFDGVPKEYLADEVGLPEKELAKWIRAELGLGRYTHLPEFIPFDIVAGIVTFGSDIVDKDAFDGKYRD